MRGEAGSALRGRVEAFEQERLAGVHRGEVVPSVAGAKSEQINFVLDALAGRAQVGGREGLGVAYGEGAFPDDAGDRAPDVDHGVTAREEGRGLVGEVEPDAAGRRDTRVIR